MTLWRRPSTIGIKRRWIFIQYSISLWHAEESQWIKRQAKYNKCCSLISVSDFFCPTYLTLEIMYATYMSISAKGLQRAGRAVNRRLAAQLGSGLWARWLVNGPGHGKMLGPRPGLWARGLRVGPGRAGQRAGRAKPWAFLNKPK